MAVFLIIPIIVFIGSVTYELWPKGKISAQKKLKKTIDGKRKMPTAEEDIDHDSLFLIPGNPGYKELQTFFRDATNEEVEKMYKLIEGKNTMAQAKKFLEEWIGDDIKAKTRSRMTDLIGKILISSVRNLFEKQPDIFDFRPQTGETEWNLGHHLSNEIREYLFWLNHDIDITKRNYENKRPDMVFHFRGTVFNFLVIELKHRNADNSEDISKIQNDWMGEGLRYRYGASIKIKNRDEFEVTVFNRDGISRTFNQTTSSITSDQIKPTAISEAKRRIDNSIRPVLAKNPGQVHDELYDEVERIICDLNWDRIVKSDPL